MGEGAEHENGDLPPVRGRRLRPHRVVRLPARAGERNECPECEGLGQVPELLEEISGPEPLQRTPYEAELLAEWVRAYREARRRGLPPEEARRAAEGEVWGLEELPF